MSTSEEDPGVRLMLAWQQGDETAFDRIVERYSGQVFALLTRFLGPVAQREDLVQEVFLRLIRARDRYQPSARFSTWLYRIVFNLAANEREKARLRNNVSLDAMDPTGEGASYEPEDTEALLPSEALERDDAVRAVQDAIARLPQRQRMALILAKYEGLPYAEIGEVLGSNEKAVKSMIHRARENLRSMLSSYLTEETA
ncbi:MAG: RNA polymerase sigma factor [Planctomycetota bacterium]|jgi:RNA polymerase sigma-70 factor (ECF subfamily)